MRIIFRYGAAIFSSSLDKDETGPVAVLPRVDDDGVDDEDVAGISPPMTES